MRKVYFFYCLLADIVLIYNLYFSVEKSMKGSRKKHLEERTMAGNILRFFFLNHMAYNTLFVIVELFWKIIMSYYPLLIIHYSFIVSTTCLRGRTALYPSFTHEQIIHLIFQFCILCSLSASFYLLYSFLTPAV